MPKFFPCVKFALITTFLLLSSCSESGKERTAASPVVTEFIAGNVGPSGERGETGEKGEKGAQFLAEMVNPTNLDGNEGDSFLNSTTKFFYKKMNGIWTKMA